MVEKVNNIPKILFISETENIPLLRVTGNENKSQAFSDTFCLRDINKDEEIYIRTKIEKYEKYTLSDLKEIANNPDELQKFYQVYNLAVYNNFYDIADIIYQNLETKENIQLNINEGNLKLSDNQKIEFVANVKSLPRIIEKMQRKRKVTLSEVWDVVRGRINCENVHQARQILEILQRDLPSKNKEIIEVDDMVTNPRPEYKGRIHLAIKDNETGAMFELQIGSKNITEFIEKPVIITYGTKTTLLNNGANAIEIEDNFVSNYHDLIYKALKKLKNNPKYKYLWQDLERVNQKYLQIMDQIYSSEMNNTYEKNKDQITKSINELDKLVISTFSKVKKEDIIEALEA